MSYTVTYKICIYIYTHTYMCLFIGPRASLSIAAPQTTRLRSSYGVRALRTSKRAAKRAFALSVDRGSLAALFDRPQGAAEKPRLRDSLVLPGLRRLLHLDRRLWSKRVSGSVQCAGHLVCVPSAFRSHVVWVSTCTYLTYARMYACRKFRLGQSFVETGWSTEEGHPYYSMATIRLVCDSRHFKGASKASPTPGVPFLW